MNIRQVEVKGINLASFYPFYQTPNLFTQQSNGVKGVKMYIFIEKVEFLGRNNLENNLKLFSPKHPRTSLINIINPKQFRKG